MEELPLLYHPDLLAYANKHPLYQEEHSANFVVRAYNPLCGDKFELRFDCDKVITNTSFYGHGCVVSHASAGLLMERLRGQTPEAAAEMLHAYLERILADAQPTADYQVEMLAVSRRFPGRVQCATMAWDALSRHALFARQNL